MTSIRGSSDPITSLVSRTDRPIRDRMNDKPIISPLRNLSAAKDTVQYVPGSYSDRSNWVYEEVVPRVSKELGSQFLTEVHAKIERAECQQLDSLIPAVLEPDVQTSLDIARTSWRASLEEKMMQMIKMVDPTTIRPLSWDLKVSIENLMFRQADSLTDSRLLDLDVFVAAVRAQVK